MERIPVATPMSSSTLDVLMRVLASERVAMHAALNVLPRNAKTERETRWALIAALEAYEAALDRRNLPVSFRLREELSIQRALDRR